MKITHSRKAFDAAAGGMLGGSGGVTMRVFIANFGLANRLWPSCHKGSTVATFDDEDLRPFWLAKDHAGYIDRCVTTKRTAAGKIQTKQVASRWFNLATIISSTANDVWIHHEKDELWWTISLPGEAQVSLEKGAPPSSERVYVIRKPAMPWLCKNKTGERLRWETLHPKARDFLFTMGTFQQLSADNAAYAWALIEGRDLEPWHRRSAWQAKGGGARSSGPPPLDPIMNTLPLQLRDGHLFVKLGGELWLLDTGAPTSFGTSSNLTIAGKQFSLGTNYLGLTAATLSQFVGVPCVGLLGADVLGGFDLIFDIPGGRLTLSTAELSHGGQSVPLDDFMGIPIVTARVGGNDYSFFFDTGAQISYFQDDSLTTFPSAGRVTDFYPGAGQFQTDTYEVPVTLGGVDFTLRCGRLPGLLGTTLMMAGTVGILGNEILNNRVVGYFPRRRLMVL